MKLIIQIIISLILYTGTSGYAQSYPPAAGFEGSDAVHKDSSILKAWAVSAELKRGLQNISNPEGDTVSFGTVDNVLGAAQGNPNVVSLGDGGSIILQFNHPICNGTGPDFAVFENGFRQDSTSYNAFLEFAFVEVSSDGKNYYRFPAISEIQTETQTGSFTETDARYIHNLAGKYTGNYGTPFDLEEMKYYMNSNFNINNITHIKIIDVTGTVNPEFASYDSNGNIINDPYPTNFPSGGFDADAVGVIHQNRPESKNTLVITNPASSFLSFPLGLPEIGELYIYSVCGQLVFYQIIENQLFAIDIHQFETGAYIVKLKGLKKTYTQKVFVLQ